MEARTRHSWLTTPTLVPALLALLLPTASADPAAVAAPGAAEPMERGPSPEDTGVPVVLDNHLEVLRNDWVYPGPARTRERRGRVTAHEVVVVLDEVEGSGCKGRWGRIEGGGFLCLDRTRPTPEAPTALPRLLAFDSPEPAEFWDYVKTGEWDRAPDAEAEALVPWIYGKRWRRWQGEFFDSRRDFERYRAPSDRQLEGNRKYHFAGVEETRRGAVLTRRNGQVVPMDGIHLYPIPRFAGRNLEDDPLPS
ncbi:MAG: hypothetical protein VX000_10240, partial [Myxococcota bacterium]|nr:hypothetical protein [Myxococcota bacterium]